MTDTPGSARLVLVEGVLHLNEEIAVFEAMLTGWSRQQRSRMLGESTIAERDRLVRRFAEFAESYPWSWSPGDGEDFTGPLFAGLRDAEARGLDDEAVLPQLVAGKSLADAADVASVLHSRVDRWSHAAGGRRRHTGQLIAGLFPRAQGVTDPDMARALAERDQAMEQRALSLAEEAIAGRHTWVRPLGPPPSGSARRERWLREVSTVAAYRDRWHIEGQRPLGAAPHREDLEQTAQRKRALVAEERAKAISTDTMNQPINHGLEPRLEISQGVEL